MYKKTTGETHVLQENLQYTTGLLVDQARDTFDTATTSETANGLDRRYVKM